MSLGSIAPLRKAFTQAARPIAVIGAVGGFIGDIIQPLGNFAVWIAGLSLVIAIGALVWVIVLRRRAGEEIWDTLAAGLFVLAVGSFVVFAAWSIIFAVGPERGYLASNIEPIAQVQAQLLGLQKDVTEIKQTTQVTATRVAQQSDVQVAQATKQAEAFSIQSAAATAQAKGFADLQTQFAALQKGTLIDNPTTPQEWYSNARLYQLQGDTAKAIKAYEGYFQYGLDFVDPYLEYGDLVKATDGIVRARERINVYYNARRDSPTLDLVSARLLDNASDRLARYSALAARAPQFGPVYYELGAEYNRALGAAPTSDLMKKQTDAYNALFKIEQDAQGYTRYFIDKGLAEKNLADAQRMFDAYANARGVMGKVDALVYQYNDGMMFIVSVSETGVKKLLFELDNPKPARATGMITATGTPNMSIGKIPLPVGKHTLYLQYIDANDTPSQVFEKEFLVRQVFATFQQQPLDFSTNTFSGAFLTGVTGAKFEDLFTYRWSVDSDALDQSKLGGGMFSIEVKGLTAGDHVLYLQAATQDGSKTYEMEKIPFVVK
ncbi:MAG: hypothetical protein HY741_22145 [Chloroflexi bacterium]|nr:hypothetical protein [Chloroflexota bacterium]